MIPQECGGTGLGLSAATVIMAEINRSGGNAGAVHGQIYNMGALLRNGSKAQKDKYLPEIAAGKLRIQSMAVTEPSTGSDTTKIKTTAEKKGWLLRGQRSKILDVAGPALRFDDPLEGVVGGRQRLHADAWRFWLRYRIQHRAQVPRDEPLPGASNFHEPDLLVRC